MEYRLQAKYHLDLSKFSLAYFREDIRARVMIPSRVSLKDDLDARFQVLQDNNLSTMKELSDALKTKQKLEAFAHESGLDPAYLTLLKREANSYLPGPVRLDRFPGIFPDDLSGLNEIGITNTRHLFNRSQEPDARDTLIQTAGISPQLLDKLICLSDLSRAYGVGPVLAHMLYNVGIHTTADFIQRSAAEIIAIYESKTGKKADFGVNEIQFSLDLAQQLDIPA